MFDKFAFIDEEMTRLREASLLNNPRVMGSPADGWMVVDGKRVLNFCANNYLGLANHPRLKEAAHAAIERWGARGLVIDISGLDIVDSYVARVLADTGQMARLMGTDTVLAGMRPEVAATLVRMGYRMEGVRTALDVDEALALLGGGRN